MSEEVIILDSLRIGSISLLVGYLCIPWCELPILNINEKSSYLLSAHFTLVCNFSSMITLANVLVPLWEHLEILVGFGKLSIGQ